MRSQDLPGAWFQLGTILPNHVLFLAMGVVRVGPEGLAMGGKLLPREHYMITLDEANRRLLVQARPDARDAARLLPSPKPLRAPRRRFDDLHSILTAWEAE